MRIGFLSLGDVAIGGTEEERGVPFCFRLDFRGLGGVAMRVAAATVELLRVAFLGFEVLFCLVESVCILAKDALGIIVFPRVVFVFVVFIVGPVFITPLSFSLFVFPLLIGLTTSSRSFRSCFAIF
jgi:hypothetical protein